MNCVALLCFPGVFVVKLKNEFIVLKNAIIYMTKLIIVFYIEINISLSCIFLD